MKRRLDVDQTEKEGEVSEGEKSEDRVVAGAQTLSKACMNPLSPLKATSTMTLYLL